MMEEFASESDSDYTSYWRDWVSLYVPLLFTLRLVYLLAFSLC